MEDKKYIKTEYTVDFGKAGMAHVTVLDPCISEEAQSKRRAELCRVCQDLIRKGEI